MEITFPSGVYDYEDINDFIHEKIGKLEDGKNYGINILFDFSTYKVFIKLDENYQIDFVSSGNFHDLLGFDKKLLKGSAFGDFLPNITNSIDNIYLRCSLLSESIIDHRWKKIRCSFHISNKYQSSCFAI